MRHSLAFVSLVGLAGLAGCNPNLGLDNTSESSSGGETAATTSTSEPPPTTTFDILCTPGQERCADDHVKEVCSATGLAWQQVPCSQYQTCSETGEPPVAECLGPCETVKETSIGCEFLAIRMRSENAGDDPADDDAIIVGNTDTDKVATVRLFLTPNYFNEEEPIGNPVTLGPGESYIFRLSNDIMPNFSSFRAGGVYHVVSDFPVSAYLHSPLANSDSNDASLLLPIKALGTDYVVHSFPPRVGADPEVSNGRPSYFNIIATENDTEVEWTPRYDTAGDEIAVFSVKAKQTGKMLLNRMDVIQIGASSKTNDKYTTHDVSGTIIRANKPIVVMGATSCANVPTTATESCNHLQEQILPIKYWGTRYVAAHAPLRGGEKHYWRVYAGASNQQFTVEPAVAGVPNFSLPEVGAFKDIVMSSGVSTTFKSTKAFMAVQYIAGGEEVTGENFGDPAMYQTIPVDQYLDRYVFVTGANYSKNYVQVIRRNKAADVFIDGVAVEGWYNINATGDLNVQVADVDLGPTGDAGVHLAESEDPFGINVIGYVTRSAYAYPGGMALKVLNPEGGG